MTATRKFPLVRLRRLRQFEALRDLVRETRLDVDDFIYPLFIVHGTKIRKEIPSMPGVFHLSVDALIEEAKEIESLGIKAVMLFGIPAQKDAGGSENFDANGIVQQATHALREHNPNLAVFTDVCMCEYTDHGHCGHRKVDDNGVSKV
ncbi:MAG: porphobilinogen synthase, partial [Gammaproteobacteria bacterium]|nr:porphobilinogen synthase [Gammaproteobacteria bacterium]